MRSRSILIQWVCPSILGALLASCGESVRQPNLVEEAASKSPPPGLSKAGPAADRRPAVRFQRSKYASSPTSAGGANLDLLETPEERERALQIISRLEAVWGNRTAVGNLMAEARLLETNAILRVAEKLAGHPDEDIRAEAVMLADGSTSTAVLKLLGEVMKDPSPDVRRLAMESALRVEDPATRSVINQGLLDEDLGVRQLAFHVAMNQQEEIRQDVVMRALESPLADLAAAALVEAEAKPSKAMLPKVIEALGHSSAEVREQANEMLTLWFHENFSGPDQAAQWWRQNAGTYDDDLVYSAP
jgi:hypothetical protein